MHLARACLLGAFAHGAFLHLGDARGHRDDHTRSAHGAAVVVNLADEMPQHRLRHLKVGDHAVLQRADGGDAAGRAAQHAFRVITHGHHLVGAGFDRHHRRFPQYDSVIFDINQRVCGSEVDANVFCDKTKKSAKPEHEFVKSMKG